MRRLLTPPLLLLLLAAIGPVSAQTDLGTAEQRESGRVLYDKYCAQCHGTDGAGDGIAASRVKPRPRDFTTGKYKLRTTPSGALPTDDDIARAIRNGLPYTSMPPWPQLSNQDVQNLVYYLKTFSEDFANPDKHGEPIRIPDPPPFSEESAQLGRQVYQEMGCIQCHGDQGRGDGSSAPTMTDDWGHPIRPADMTMPWTFRGGPTRSDVFRTFTTGLNGTPMPAYAESIPLEDRWHLVDYIASLSEGEDPGYDNLVFAAYVERELDPSAEAELFADAPPSRLPLVGQIMQPGRAFHPPVSSVVVQAVHNRRDLAIRVRWNDMRAETSGQNDPTLEVPSFGEGDGAGAQETGEGGDFWGDEEVAQEQEEEGDFWGDEEAGEDDFWGEEDAADAAATPDTEFSDAVALQFPESMPTGIRKPYFIFGDAQFPVDLWFVDLAHDAVQQYTGRGSDSLEPRPGGDVEVFTRFDRGEWSVIFKRSMKAASGIPFEPSRYLPLAVSVWDGFNRERGNKRALTQWQYLYIEPPETVSPVGPMIRIALLVLIAELLVIGIVRRKFSGSGLPAGESARDRDYVSETSS